MKKYSAPWSASLWATTTFAVIIALGAFAVPSLVERPIRVGDFLWLRLLPIALVPILASFAIRGYTIAPDSVLVHRLFWSTVLPRAGLQSARFEPNAMARSIRTFGNGGFFSFTGYYTNKTLGSYRAFVTDPARTVVLRYAGETIVVSPGEPEDFASSLTAQIQ